MDEAWLASEIAGRLRAARAKADLTQHQAGDRAGCSWMTIHRAERASRIPSVETLYGLAAAYGVPVHTLLPTEAELPADPKGRPRKRKA